jgi:hypothetical protein
VPATAFTFNVFLGLSALAWQTANGLWRLRLLELELNVVHVEMKLRVLVLANLHPLILAQLDLLEVDDVVASGAIAVRIKVELVASEAFKLYIAQVLEQFGSFGWSHRFAQAWTTVAEILVHVPEDETLKLN